MKCETKIPYKVHNEDESKSFYPCGRTVTHQVEYLDEYKNHNVVMLCGIHLKVFQKESEKVGLQITVIGAK